MHQIDASFRERKQETATRRRQSRRRKWISGGLSLLLLALGSGFWLTKDQWSFNAGREAEPLGEAGPQAAAEPERPVFVPAIVWRFTSSVSALARKEYGRAGFAAVKSRLTRCLPSASVVPVSICGVAPYG